MTQVQFALSRYQQSRAILEALQEHRPFSHVSFSPRLVQRFRWPFVARLA